MGSSGLYDDPLVYDVLHAPGTAREVDGFERIEHAFAPRGPARRWLEPACGTGRYLRLAASRGIDVVGFDLSGAMVEFARSRASEPGAPGRAGARAGKTDLFVADMTDFARHVERGSISFAFNPINTIRHLRSDDAMIEHLRGTARVLAPAGVYVVGLHLTLYGGESPSEDVWVGERGRLRVTQLVQYLPPKSPGNASARSELVISQLFIERGREREDRAGRYRLRCYSLRQWERVVRMSGLEILASVDEQGRASEACDGAYAIFVLGRAPNRTRSA